MQIAEAAAEVKSAALSPTQYASLGITLATKSCDEWFAALIRQAQSSAFGVSELTLVGGTAAMAGGPAGATAGAVLSLLASSLASYQSATGGQLPHAMLHGLVKRMQDAWLSAMPTPLSEEEALALVQSYAELCQPPAVLRAVQQAMATVPVSVSWAEENGPSLVAGRNTRRFRLPMVLVGNGAAPIVATKTRRQLNEEFAAVSRHGRAAVERSLRSPRRLRMPPAPAATPTILEPPPKPNVPPPAVVAPSPPPSAPPPPPSPKALPDAPKPAIEPPSSSPPPRRRFF